MKIGILAWSIRHSLKRDFVATLKTLAEQGCQGVHFINDFGGVAPAELAELLAGLGLEACAIHASSEELLDEHHLKYEYAKALGCKRVTASLSNPDFADNYPEYAETCRQVHVIAADHGITFSYHNHGVEFADVAGKTAFDLFCSCLDEGVRLNLNALWAQMGGVDPIRFLSSYLRRASIVHIGGCDAEANFCDLGTGVFPLSEVVALVEDRVEWAVCDLDNDEDHELESARCAMEHLERVRTASGVSLG